jgi:hypothetical protein
MSRNFTWASPRVAGANLLKKSNPINGGNAGCNSSRLIGNQSGVISYLLKVNCAFRKFFAKVPFVPPSLLLTHTKERESKKFHAEYTGYPLLELVRHRPLVHDEQFSSWI